jgi:hypothetical protein
LPAYELVIGSDVLYERPYGELVARVIRATLAPDGVAIIADPGRVGRQPFLDSLAASGLVLRGRHDVPFEEGPIRQTIGLLEITRHCG